MQRKTDTPQCRTFGLRHGAIGMDHRAAVEGLPDLLDADRFGLRVDCHVCDAGDPGRHVAFLAVGDRDTHALTIRQVLSPSRAITNIFENGS